MKIEIWAPYPYQVVALRGPDKDELYLASDGEVVKEPVGSRAYCPILELSEELWDQQVVQGLKGKFKDSNHNDWTSGQYLLKRYLTHGEKSVCFEGSIQGNNTNSYVDNDDAVWDEFLPTQLRSFVEVEVPEGFQAIRYGRAKPGEEFIYFYGGTPMLGPSTFDGLVIKPAGRSPTVEDMGKQCRFSVNGKDWIEGRLQLIQVDEGGQLCYNPFGDDWAYGYCEVTDED